MSVIVVVIINLTESHVKVDCVCRSGGHFNPAVTLSVYLCGGMELLLTVPYLAAQILGGMIGAGLTKVRKCMEDYSGKKKA